MRIGIIGAGNIGSTLARKLAKAGHSVLIANSRGPETLRSLADETEAKAVSARDAVHGVVGDTGFDAIDGGSLAESWRQQPITLAYCSELTADALRAALAAAERSVRHSCARRWSGSSWPWETRSRQTTSCACTGRRFPGHETQHRPMAARSKIRPAELRLCSIVACSVLQT